MGPLRLREGRRKGAGVLAVLLACTAAPTQSEASENRSCYRFVRSAAQRAIVHRESRGNPNAQNPRSSAFGCGQLLTMTRLRHGRRVGVDPNTRSPRGQMLMMSDYIDVRYGSDERALQYWLRHKHY